MAPLEENRRAPTLRRSAETVNSKRQRPAGDSPSAKNNRSARRIPPGPRANDKGSDNIPDAGKGPLGGKGGGGGTGGGLGKGLKSNRNDANSDDGKSRGNNDEDSDDDDDDDDDDKKDSSSNNSKGSPNSNGRDNKNKGNGNEIGNGSNIGTAAARATATSSISDDDGASDSNGAQQLSSDSIGATTTDAATAAAATTSPTSVVLTTSTIVTTGPDAVVTSFIPLITTSVAGSEATATRKSFAGFGAFGTDFSGFSGLPKPTGKEEDSDDDDKKHRGDDSDNSTSSSDDNKGDDSKGKDNDKSPKGLDSTAERALISVGSIGALIVICFIFWLVWRAFRKQKQKKIMAQGKVSTFQADDGPFAGFSRLPGRAYGHVINKIPFLNRNHKAWQTLEETSTSSIAPVATDTLEPSQMRNAAPADYGEKGGNTLRTFGLDGELPPTVPSQVYYSSGLGLQFQRQEQKFDASSVNNRIPANLIRSNSSVSAYTHSPAGSFSSSHTSATSTMQQAALPHVSNGNMGVMSQPIASIILANGQQFIASDASDISNTLRSRMPDPFYNQSQLARQPSDAYDPTRRQVSRVSELSSLSSGFGDGEMLILEQGQGQGLMNLQKPLGDMPMAFPPPPIPSEPVTSKGQFSWMRNKRVSRETVYTEASEDQPAKFRSVDSWVNQQTGRVRRAQASIDTTSASSQVAGTPGGDVALMPGNEPGIPHPLPAEQRLTMMMDDEEIPRRPDTVPGLNR